MSDLETQNDDLRASLESAFTAAETPSEPVEKPAIETPAAETKTERARDESGKFAKSEKAPEAPPQDTAPVVPEVPVKRAPSSWKKETQAEWEKLPAHVQDDVLRRENDFHKGIESYKQAAARAHAVDQAIAPYQQTLQALGVTPEAAIGALFKADHLLRTGAPHEKAQYFAQLAKEYGVALDQIQNPPQVDPAYQQVLNELQTLKASQQRDLQMRQQAEARQIDNTISAFADGKEHFDAVREDMAALLQAGRAKDLDTAYDMAIWARPDLRSRLIEQQTKAAEEKARAEVQKAKAQSAAVSVRGSSPVSGQTATPTDIRAALEAAFNSH